MFIAGSIAWKAMEACIETARENGVAFATIKNASHHGFGGYYVMHAAEQGMIDLVDHGVHAVQLECLPRGQADRGILKIQVELERPVALGNDAALKLARIVLRIHAQIAELRPHRVAAHLAVADLARFYILDRSSLFVPRIGCARPQFRSCGGSASPCV